MRIGELAHPRLADLDSRIEGLSRSSRALSHDLATARDYGHGRGYGEGRAA